MELLGEAISQFPAPPAVNQSFHSALTAAPVSSIQFTYELNANRPSTVGLTASHKRGQGQRTRSRDTTKLLSPALLLLKSFPPFKGPEDVSILQETRVRRISLALSEKRQYFSLNFFYPTFASRVISPGGCLLCCMTFRVSA